MRPRRAVLAGLVLAALAHLWYGVVQFVMFPGIGVVTALVTGLGLVQAAVGVGMGPRGRPVLAGGLAMAALASVTDFRGILFDAYTLINFAGFMEGAGLVLMAAAVPVWMLADDDLDPAALVLRTGAALSGASGIVYLSFTLLAFPSPWIVPNLLIVGGLGLVAWKADAGVLAPPGANEPAGDAEGDASAGDRVASET